MREEQRRWAIAAALYAALSLLLTFTAFLPSHLPLPLDLPRDYAAWKHDPRDRVAVSNKDLSDPIFEYLAWDHEVRDRIAARQFPWRSAYAGGGAHLFANPETALFTPLTWPRLLFGDRGWAFTLFFRLFFGALGMWWFARTLTGCDWRSALVSGAAWATCGFFTVWLAYTHTNVAAVLPWFGAAVLLSLRRRSRGRIAGVILTAALLTAGGHPETIFYGALGIAALAAWQWRDERWPARNVTVTAASTLLGLLLLAIQLMPFAFALSKSYFLAEREAPRPAAFRLFAIPSTFLPGYLGSPLAGEIDLSGLAQPAAENFNERNGGYAGAIVLIVALVAWRGLPKAARRALVIGLVALFVSWNPPLVRSVLRHLPLFSVGANARIAMLFAFFATATAGAALDVLDAGRPRRRAAIVIGIAGALLLAGGIVLSLPAARPALLRIARDGIVTLRKRNYLQQPAFVYERRLWRYLAGFQALAVGRIALPGACIMATGLALASSRRRRAMIATAIAVEMIGFAYGYTPAVPRPAAAALPPAIDDVLRDDTQHVFLIAAAPETYPPNMGSIQHVRDIRSYDVLQPQRRIGELRAIGYDTESKSFPAALTTEQINALGSLGVRYFLTRVPPPGLAIIGGDEPPGVGAYEITTARPTPWPRNDPPEGLRIGVVISLIALLASIALVWRAPEQNRA